MRLEVVLVLTAYLRTGTNYMYQVEAAFDELDEEEDSDTVRCLTHPETVGRRHGNSGSD